MHLVPMDCDERRKEKDFRTLGAPVLLGIVSPGEPLMALQVLLKLTVELVRLRTDRTDEMTRFVSLGSFARRVLDLRRDLDL